MGSVLATLTSRITIACTGAAGPVAFKWSIKRGGPVMRDVIWQQHYSQRQTDEDHVTAIGFISEHTAEYILVPRLVSLLSPHFARIVPFYFWSTREGNSMSRECGPREWVRLLSIFARRPKVTSTHDSRIVMKLNTDLFRAANIASDRGIPVFAGVPLVTSIAGLTLDAPCQWFRLAPDPHDVPDTEIAMQSNGALNGAALPDYVTGPLDSDAFVRIIHQTTQPMNWDEGIESLRYIRSNSHVGYRFFGGYKPFHMMLFDS